MITIEELRAAAIPFALPMRRPFRGITVREGVLINGPSGWGEFAPFDDYSPAAAGRWLSSAIEAAYGSWPKPLRGTVPVNAIIPSVGPDDAATLTREAVLDRGCTTIKVKVGQSLIEDEARVASIRDALDATLGRGEGRIRLDANGLWSLDEAKRSLRRLSAYGLEYVEQPCAGFDDLRSLRAAIDVPIAVDETIRTSADPQSVRVREVADIAILKAAPLGGARSLLAIAERVGVPVVVSGSLDSAVGLDSGVAAAAALGQLPFACGLGTGALFVEDLTATPRVPVSGFLPVGRTTPDLDALLAARERVTSERVGYWDARLVEAWPFAVKG